MQTYIYHDHLNSPLVDPDPGRQECRGSPHHKTLIASTIRKNTSDLYLYCIVLQFLQAWIQFRIGIQPKMLDPDMESINPDPKHRNKIALLG